MKSGAMKRAVTPSFVVGRVGGAPPCVGHSIGPPVGDEQQQADHQQRGDHEAELVPTALMCEDHPDDRTVLGNISRAPAVLLAERRQRETGVT